MFFTCWPQHTDPLTRVDDMPSGNQFHGLLENLMINLIDIYRILFPAINFTKLRYHPGFVPSTSTTFRLISPPFSRVRRRFRRGPWSPSPGSGKDLDLRGFWHWAAQSQGRKAGADGARVIGHLKMAIFFLCIWHKCSRYIYIYTYIYIYDTWWYM